MKTRDQLRFEDAERVVKKYSAMIDAAPLTNMENLAVRRFQISVLLFALRLPNSVPVYNLAGEILTELGKDIVTLEKRLDEAILAQANDGDAYR